MIHKKREKLQILIMYMASEISKHMLMNMGGIFVFVASIVEVLRIANSIVLKRERFGGSIEVLAILHQFPQQFSQSPAPIAAIICSVDARVFFVHRNARRRHTAGEIRRLPVHNIAAHSAGFTNFPISNWVDKAWRRLFS